MALYGKLDLADMTRFFNMGKDLGAFFISSYKEGVSDEENIERAGKLLKLIQEKKFSYVPIFAGDFGSKVINKGRVCYFVINRKGASNDIKPLFSIENLLDFGFELCKEFGKERLIVLNNGESRDYSLVSKDYCLLHWGVFFKELVHMATDSEKEIIREIKVEYYIRTFLTMSGLTCTGYGGEIHPWKEEFPYGEDSSFED